jgi:5-methyltetrahydropteroyltriglutamate--homocysteine methyltransferase
MAFLLITIGIKEGNMIRTAIAGSLPKPAWLAEPEKLWAQWQLQGDVLEQAKRDAALIWIKEQEDAGLSTICEGEQFRIHFVHGILEHIDGIDWQKKTRMGIRNDRYTVDVPTVTAPVKRKYPIHKAEAEFTRAHTTRKVKFTMPGPMTICDTIADGHYGSRIDMAMAFADLLNEEAMDLEAAGADIIQFDEPAFNAFTVEAAEWGVAALERAKRGLKCKTAVHICYGYGIQANNDWKKTLGDQWRQYEAFFPTLNASSIDQVSLEFANSKVPPELMRLLSDKEVMVGVIDVSSNEVETASDVARRIEAASAFVDPARMIACTNCGLAPLTRQAAIGKLRALGEGARLAT